jgi:acetyl-CoA synthetase
MSNIYPVPESAQARAHVDEAEYARIYEESVENNEAFWAETAKRLDWTRFPTKIKDVSFDRSDLHIRWFEDGTLNACYNCVDRHLDTRGDQTAIIWEGDNPDRDAQITYRDLHRRVCRMANVLKKLGVEKGDRVTIYMPMIPEAAISMLACARIGAIHSVVFGGFSPDALAGRIIDCDSKLVVTADQGLRGGRIVPLKASGASCRCIKKSLPPAKCRAFSTASNRCCSYATPAAKSTGTTAATTGTKRRRSRNPTTAPSRT